MVQAQPLKDLSPIMQHKLEQVPEGQCFSVFLKAQGAHWEQALASGKVHMTGSIKGYSLVSLNKEALYELMQAGALSYVGIQLNGGQPLNDRMVLNNNIVPLHQGVDPLEGPLKGEGVLVGIVDAGIELLHPDLQWEDGSTRVVKLWDQKFIYDAAHIPQPYGFGTEWTQAEIDAGICTHEDQIQYFGHGTNVTGIACGDGSALGLYGGVAPLAEMAIVSFDFDRPDFLAEVANSIQYIFNVAEEEGKPCVVNTSLGDYYGSHDGNDPASLYIDSLITAAPGRAVVAAVGNSNAVTPYHLHVDVTADTSFTWFERESTLLVNGPGVLFEVWADVEDFANVRFAIAADKILDGYSKRGQGDFHTYDEALGLTLIETLENANGDELAQIQYWAQLQGDQVQLQVYLPNPDSSSYVYRFIATGSGAYDIWSTNIFGTSDMIQANQLPSASVFPDIAAYVSPDNRMHMVSSWTCSDKVITVANYVNRNSYVNYLNELTTINEVEGAIALSSSRGPTRDGRQKPDLAATGTVTLTTGSYAMLEALIQNEPHKVAPGGMHYRNAGSSMASPVVAGVAALFFEQCPQADWEDLKNALLSTTATDQQTGTVPNERWGWGKVNGYGAVSSFSIEPELSIEGDSLQAGGGSNYSWYLNGDWIASTESDALFIGIEGVYQVEVFNEVGCSRFSEEILVTSLAEQAVQHITIRPNPSGGLFELLGVLPEQQTFRVVDLEGKEVAFTLKQGDGIATLDLSEQAEGTYLLYLMGEKMGKGMKLIVRR